MSVIIQIAFNIISYLCCSGYNKNVIQNNILMLLILIDKNHVFKILALVFVPLQILQNML